MEQFEIMKQLGEGSYGRVYQARDRKTGEIVAVKQMKTKCGSWQECINTREVKSLRKMNHPNIVKLKQVTKQHNVLYFVFEHMDCNLLQFFQKKQTANNEDQVRNWCYQVLHALAHMHQQGYFHRDLKPENLLVSSSSQAGKEVIKIADFGMVREISSKPPYTEYVTTRWYRAPEVLLGSQSYNAAVDMWAMGTIMAEMYLLQPLFRGSNTSDQMYDICSVLGSPNQETWSDGLEIADSLNYRFPLLQGLDLSILLGPSASKDAVNLISSLCSWDPRNRPTAAQALQHPFFWRVCNNIRPRNPIYRRSSLVVASNGKSNPVSSYKDDISLMNAKEENYASATGYLQPAAQLLGRNNHSRTTDNVLQEAISNIEGSLAQLGIPQSPPSIDGVWSYKLFPPFYKLFP